MTFRPSRHSICTLATTLLTAMLVARCGARATALEPVQLMPTSALAYVEVRDPAALYDRALSPILWEKLRSLDAVDAYYASPQYAHVSLVLGLMQSQLGANWENVLRDTTEGGLAASFDAQGNTVTVVVKARSPEMLDKLNQSLLNLTALDAANKGAPSPAKAETYEGISTWTLNPEAHHAIVNGSLVLSNRADGLKAALDRASGKTKESLATEASYAEARRRAGEAVAWGFVRLDVVRTLPNVAKALGLPSDNALLELLVGGVLDSAREAPFVIAALEAKDNRLALRLAMPHDAAKTLPARKWYFQRPSEPPTPVLNLPGQIAAVTLDRDLSAFWMARDELFNDQIKKGFAQADSQFGLFFAGRDFGPEVLSEINPRWQLVVARQEFDASRPVPALKLPAFALVLELKHPDTFSNRLLAGYQTIVGLVSVGNAQNAGEPLLIESERRGAAKLSIARYLEAEGVSRDQAPIQYNFSPSCVQVGKHFVLASTEGIARQIADELTRVQPAATVENGFVTLNVGELARSIGENRDLLVSQSVLSQGSSKEEAASRVDDLFALLKLAESSTIRMQAVENEISFEWQVTTAPELVPTKP